MISQTERFKRGLMENYWYFFEIIPEDIFEDFFITYIESDKFEIDETFERFRI